MPGLAGGCRSRGRCSPAGPPAGPTGRVCLFRARHLSGSRETGLIVWEPPANRRPASPLGSRPGLQQQLEAGSPPCCRRRASMAADGSAGGGLVRGTPRFRLLCLAPVPIEGLWLATATTATVCAARGCHSAEADHRPGERRSSQGMDQASQSRRKRFVGRQLPLCWPTSASTASLCRRQKALRGFLRSQT